jgi:hypothetical protein
MVAMVAKLVTGCYGKSMVVKERHWLLWKVNDCYGISLVLKKSMVNIEIYDYYGCYGKQAVAMEIL